MNRLTSCKFNMDTACVELRYADGESISCLLTLFAIFKNAQQTIAYANISI